MNKRPLVSILIPAYNAERYIREAMASAVAQAYKNVEIVVVDDGSTDKTGEIVRSFKDSRIRYIYQENKGIIGVRNRLLKEAKGDFLTFLDADDIYLPDKVAEEVNFLLKHRDYDAVYCDLRYFFDERPDRLYKHRYTFYSGDIFEKLLEKMFITNTTFMMRKSVVKRIGFYEEILGTVEDWYYFLRMARAKMKFGFIEKPLVRFRLRWDNNTRFENQPKIQLSSLKIFEDLKTKMSMEEQKRYKIDKILFRRKLKLGLAYLGCGMKREACEVLRVASAGWLWKIFLAIFVFIITILPSSLFKFVIEKSWNLKKRKLFIPIR